MLLHLARAAEQRRRPHVRDRLLLLAGSLSFRMGLDRISLYCRHQILEHNPWHMVRRWATFGEAHEDSDFLHLLRQVQRQYPPERVEQLLSQLGVERGAERDTYYSDEEYAAALLGTTPDLLRHLFDEKEP